MKLSAVIPCYNEADNIALTVNKLVSAIEKIPHIDNFEIIVIDDHSTDGTFNVIEKMGDPRISCIRLSERKGSHVALRAGLREAVGEAVLFISADGQDDPRYLGKMLEKWAGGAKAVWGLTKNKLSEPLFVRLPAQLFYKVLLWSGAIPHSSIDISRGQFFLLDRIVVDTINKCRRPKAPIHGLILSAGERQDFVECERGPRLSGRSKWSLASRIRLAIDWLAAFSDLPFLGILDRSEKGALFFIEKRTGPYERKQKA